MPAAELARPVSLDDQARVADGVMTDLGKWGPGEWPSRPAVLTWDDGQIVNAYKDWENGKTKKDDRTQLGFFGAWKGAVLRVESDNAGKLVVLLRVACFLEHAERWEDLEKLQEFVRDWYHLPLPRQAIPQNATWHEKIAERYSQNRGLLPVWLREMVRPPPGYETAGAPEKKEKGKPSPQAALSFVPEES